MAQEILMAVSKIPLQRSALDELTLSTPDARAAYQEQRLALEIGRTIRQERKVAQLTQMQLAVKAGD
jgi:hypothetical protein